MALSNGLVETILYNNNSIINYYVVLSPDTEFKTIPNGAKPRQSIPNDADSCRTTPIHAQLRPTIPNDDEPCQTIPNHARP